VDYMVVVGGERGLGFWSLEEKCADLIGRFA
jgi:hypothetical protein